MRSNVSPTIVVVVIALISAGGTRARGEDKAVEMTTGSAVFRTHCATCLGTDARGDGPFADRLRVRPPDLTLLAKRNGGSYPNDKVYRMIDGRAPVKGHGGPDMPIWGDAFKSFNDRYSEDEVKEKIRAVVEYLKSIPAPAE